MRIRLLAIVILILISCAWAQSAPIAPSFPPLENWKAAVITGDKAMIAGLYSSDPAPQIKTAAGNISADDEVAFWGGLKARKLKLNLAQSTTPNPGTQQVAFEAAVTSGARAKAHTVYVTEVQLWAEQAGQWRIVAAQRGDVARLEQPLSKDKNIYPAGVDAKAEIKEALAHARRDHKRVILVFGANWCFDCHVLDLAFHRPDIAPLLAANYEVVHVDVGEGDKNQDLMQQYEVPMKKGIPGLAVLESDGKLLYSQQNGEFEKARALAPDDLTAFLNRWKPVAR